MSEACTVTIRFRWWVRLYIDAIVLVSFVFGLDADDWDWDRVWLVMERGIYVK